MPHSLQHVLENADELAQRMSDWQPEPGDVRDAAALRNITDAVITRGKIEAEIADAVRAARDAGHTWSAIALSLGGSAEAAQQSYVAMTKA